MNKINCLVADDELLAREIIAGYVGQLEKLNLVGSCINGTEVYNALNRHHVDLLFLDIQMPQITGVELLRTLKNPPVVVFTTAYREYALEGYELNVIDYLLKPVSFDRFLKAVDKYDLIKTPGKMLNSNDAARPVNEYEAFIYVKSEKKMVKILLKDLLYIEGLKDYVKMHLASKTIITYQTLTYFEEKLSADRFLRIHRSYIVSLSHIDAYSATHVEIGKVILQIGSSYVKDIARKLGV